jgi:hypothetical protein
MDLSEVEKLEKPLDEAGELLMVAASLIEQRGLERHAYSNAKGGLCVQGALYEASKREIGSGGSGVFYAALNRVSNLLNGQMAHSWIRNPQVTKEMVVAKLREAATLA